MTRAICWIAAASLFGGCAGDAETSLGNERVRAPDAQMAPDAAGPLPGQPDMGLPDTDAAVGSADVGTADPDAMAADPDAGRDEPDAEVMPDPDAAMGEADAEPDADIDAPDAAPEPDMGPVDPNLDPGAPGPYAVSVEAGVNVALPENSSSTLIVCTPEENGAPLDEALPLVVISPGFQLETSLYRSYCERIASWGFFTVIRSLNVVGFTADHPAMARDLSGLIDVLTANDSPYAGQIDASAIAAAGHSLGGKLSALAAADDDRIDGVIGWDPVDADPPGGFGVGASVVPERGGDLSMPVLVFGETLDADPVFGFGPSCAPADQNYTQYYDAASGEATEITFAGADHVDWLDNVNCGLFCNACQSGMADDAVVRSITQRTTVAFLLLHLQGMQGMARWVDGDGLDADEQAGTITVRSR
ncbi:MAG: chlorophyllase/cutinase-like alpha/beta fold protein [Bradymonadia bacterium]